MLIERTNGPPIIIGKRVLLGQVVGAACAWGFWLAEYFWQFQVPAAMVTQATTLLIGIIQMFVVNRYGITTVPPTRDRNDDLA